MPLVKNPICIILTQNIKNLEMFHECKTAAKLLELPFLSAIGVIFQIFIKDISGNISFTPESYKSKINQKPQFLSTHLANFWYFTISRHVSIGNLLNFGPSPPQKTFQVLDHCVANSLNS